MRAEVKKLRGEEPNQAALFLVKRAKRATDDVVPLEEGKFFFFWSKAGDWRGIRTIAIVDKKTPTSVAVSGVVSSRNLLERGKNAGVCEGCLNFRQAREWEKLVLFRASAVVPMCGLTWAA